MLKSRGTEPLLFGGYTTVHIIIMAPYCATVRARTYVYTLRKAAYCQFATPTCTYQLSLLCTALQSVIYVLVAAAFITGEDRHDILILPSVYSSVLN